MGYGYRRKPEEYMSMIDAVTEADIVRIADRMLAGRPCLAGYGEIGKLAVRILLEYQHRMHELNIASIYWLLRFFLNLWNLCFILETISTFPLWNL